MALTKQQALDKFCIKMGYDGEKLQGETKLEFLKRRQKEWAIDIVIAQIRSEKVTVAETDAKTEVIGLDI